MAKISRRLQAVMMFVGGATMIVTPMARHVWWPIIVWSAVVGASICVLSIAVWMIAGDLEQAENDLRELREDAKNAAQR